MLRKILSLDSNSDFYKRNLSWTGRFVDRNLPIIQENYKKFPNRNKWKCDCHVSHEDQFDVDRIDYEFLRKEYVKISKKFCKERKLKFRHVSDVWYNYYETGQYQEPHDHGQVGYTAVHYLIFDPHYHEQTKFYDPGFVTPKVVEGDILFFAANKIHYVPPNNSTKPTLTIAFTLIVE